MNATYKDLLEVTNKVNGGKIFPWLFYVSDYWKFTKIWSVYVRNFIIELK